MRIFSLIIGAVLLTASVVTAQPVISPQPPSTTAATTETNSPGRHRINVTLTALEDLKVKEGQRVEQGDVISDRTSQRQELEARYKQLEIAIKQMSLPSSAVTELPPPNFAVEETAVERAKLELHQLDKAFLPENRFLTADLQAIHDRKLLEARAKLQEQKTRAAMELNTTVAALEKSRANYQQQQYQHSLNLIQQQVNLQRQQYQLASLVSQQEEVKAKLREVVAVKSPYSGRIRRVKILGQSDRTINVEITINVKKN